MELFELASVMADFFSNGAGPSHDELDGMFARAGLQAGDPHLRGSGTTGKMKRVRGVMAYGMDRDPEATLRLAKQLLQA